MASVSSSARLPTPAEVQQICGISNPVLRNLRITECYSRISIQFTSRTGNCANWCTFATWASKQAGSTIRGEDMLERLEDALREGSWLLAPIQSLWRFLVRCGVFYPETRLGRLVKTIHTPFDAFERASDAVARGNLKVFAEIGLEFTRYLAACPANADPGQRVVLDFLDSLRPGDAPEGQALLRTAFLLYQQQSFEPDTRVRGQMICLANLLIGLHEQTRLQPEIREAMESVPATVHEQSRLLRLLAPIARNFRRFARDLTCRIVTESLMVLRLPNDQCLYLGKHLDRQIPGVLEPAQTPEFCSLLNRYTAADCGADDWSDLNQRMRYISRLFCGYHLDSVLFEPPFTAGQVSQMRSGTVPRGAL